MYRLAFLAGVIFTLAAAAAYADDVKKGPDGLSIQCSDFTKLSNGQWRSGPTATLSYPDRPGSFASNTFSAGDMSIGGNDIGAFLDANCAR